MKLIIFLLFISFGLNAQMQYNKIDTTWTLDYYHMLAIREKIESLKNEKEVLQKEIVLLENVSSSKDLVIKKLSVRDSLHSIEINHYITMDSLLKEKLYRFNLITNNYDMLLYSTQEQLNAEVKKAKRERLLKNLYKYTYPVAIGVAGFIILR